MCKVISSRKGFSLIELIITIAILSIVISSVFSLFSFGNNIFRKGSSQYNVQADLRLASDFVTNQLRYAADIELKKPSDVDIDALLANPGSIPVYKTFLFVKDDSLVSINTFNTVYKHMGESPAIQFYNETIDKKNIKYTISAYDSSQQYTLEGEIFALNIELGSVTAISGEPNSSIVCYTSTNDYISSKQIPIASIDSDPVNKNQVDLSFTVNPIYSVSPPDPSTLNGNIVQVSPIVDPCKLTMTVSGLGAKNNDSVVLEITFQDTDLDPNNNPLYAYTLTYSNGGGGGWSISQPGE